MNYPEALADNLRARYDTMREIRIAQDRLKELVKQSNDLWDEARNEDTISLLYFRTKRISENDPPFRTWQEVADEWERRNPRWKITSNGLRRKTT